MNYKTMKKILTILLAICYSCTLFSQNSMNDTIIARGEISISPNLATDVITVTNENVNSIAVYSIEGTLVASSESNVVNVANLVKDYIYIVMANTEAGVITGQIIKKGSIEDSIKDKEEGHVEKKQVNRNKTYYKSNELYNTYVGPRGGRYYINKNGNKTYIKRK